MQAMSCATLEAQPLLVGIRQLDTLTDESTELKNAIKAFDKALTAASVDREGAAGAKYVRTMGEARNAQARANEYAVQLALASGNLGALVDRIAEQVDKNIIDTEASPQSLQAIVDGFAAQSKAFNKAALPTSAAAAAIETETDSQSGSFTPESSKNSKPNEGVQAALERTYARLLFAIASVNSTLEHISTVSAVTQKVQACKADGVVNKFVVDPADAVVTLKLGAKQEFKVTNEVAVPTVALTGQNVESVELGDVIVREGSFIVSVTGKAVNGDAGPTLVITDGTGQQDERIVINVVAAEKPAPKNPEENKPQTADPELDKPLDAELEAPQLENSQLGKPSDDPATKVANALKVVQCVAGLRGGDVDGKMGRITRAAIEDFRTTEGPIASGIDAGLLTDVNAALAADTNLCKEFR
jgi:hypothetical protein